MAPPRNPLLRSLYFWWSDLTGGIARGFSSFFRGIGRQWRDFTRAFTVTLKEQPKSARRGLTRIPRGLWVWFRTRPVWMQVLGATGAVSVLILAVAFAPIRQAVNTWRGEGFLEESRLLQEEGRILEAFNKGKTAYLMLGESDEALSNLVRVADELERRETLAWSESLARRPTSSTEDVVFFLEKTIETGRVDRGLPYLNRLRLEETDPVRIGLLETRILLRQGRTRDAWQLARGLVESAPDNENAHQLYGIAALRLPDPEVREEAFAHFEAQLDRDDEIGLSAASLLLVSRDASAEERLDLIQRMEAHPQADRSVVLLTNRARLEFNLAPYADLAETVRDQFDLADPDQRLELARWLNEAGEPEAVLELISRTEAIGSEELFRQWVFAQIEADNPQAVVDLTDSPSQLPVDMVERRIYQGVALRELGRDSEAQTILRLAIARSEIEDMEFLEATLSWLGYVEPLVELYDKMARNPRTARYGMARLLRLGYELQRTDILDRVLPQMQFEDYPNNPSTRNLIAYLHALRGENLSSSRRVAEQLIATDPDSVSVRMTLSLIYFRSGQPELAYQILGEMSSYSDILRRDSWKVIAAAVLEANDQNEGLDSLLATVDADSLISPEAEIYGSLRSVLPPS